MRSKFINKKNKFTPEVSSKYQNKRLQLILQLTLLAHQSARSLSGSEPNVAEGRVEHPVSARGHGQLKPAVVADDLRQFLAPHPMQALDLKIIIIIL